MAGNRNELRLQVFAFFVQIRPRILEEVVIVETENLVRLSADRVLTQHHHVVEGLARLAIGKQTVSVQVRFDFLHAEHGVDRFVVEEHLEVSLTVLVTVFFVFDAVVLFVLTFFRLLLLPSYGGVPCQLACLRRRLL